MHLICAWSPHAIILWLNSMDIWGQQYGFVLPLYDCNLFWLSDSHFSGPHFFFFQMPYHWASLPCKVLGSILPVVWSQDRGGKSTLRKGLSHPYNSVSSYPELVVGERVPPFIHFKVQYKTSRTSKHKDFWATGMGFTRCKRPHRTPSCERCHLLVRTCLLWSEQTQASTLHPG